MPSCRAAWQARQAQKPVLRALGTDGLLRSAEVSLRIATKCGSNNMAESSWESSCCVLLEGASITAGAGGTSSWGCCASSIPAKSDNLLVSSSWACCVPSITVTAASFISPAESSTDLVPRRRFWRDPV